MNPDEFFADVAQRLRDARVRPYGPNADADTVREAGKACVVLCGGDLDKGRTLWKLVVQDLRVDYMPKAAAVALIRASVTTNLVPDVQAPEPQ